MGMNWPDAFGEGVLLIIFWVVLSLTAAIHITFAFGVYASARRGNAEYAGAWVWGVATLFGGPFTAVAFWLIHESALANPGFGKSADDTSDRRKLVPKFNCPECGKLSSVMTEDDCCVHCGLPIEHPGE